MLFGREKMYLGSFIRGLCSETIQSPNYSYTDYLREDPERGLSDEEFSTFTDNLLDLRLMLLFALLMDKSSTGKIKVSSIDLGRTFSHALVLAFQDNNLSKENAIEQVKRINGEVDNLFDYLETIPSENNLSNSEVAVCMYYSSKLSKSAPKPTKPQYKMGEWEDMEEDYALEALRQLKIEGTYVALVNAVRKSVKNYFDNTLKKVKIITD
jgi:hypothetical protein